jgi:hypothetical protein
LFGLCEVLMSKFVYCFIPDVDMNIRTLGIYVVGGVSIILLLWILQPYTFTVRFWSLAFVFGIGGIAALLAERWLTSDCQLR